MMWQILAGLIARPGDGEQLNIPQIAGQMLVRAFTLAGVIAVICIIVGGVTMMTSGVNPDGSKKGMAMVKGAIIGLVITLAANMIVNWFLGAI